MFDLKILMTTVLAVTFFLPQIHVSVDTYSLIAAVSIVLLSFLIVKDVLLGLLLSATCLILFSKLKISKHSKSKPETFDDKKKAEPKAISKDTVKPLPKDTSKSLPPVLPKHCDTSTLEKPFEKFSNGLLTKDVDDIQSNIFDKYNQNVFYHEAGENSLDIQGIYNHEVQGFEPSTLGRC